MTTWLVVAIHRDGRLWDGSPIHRVLADTAEQAMHEAFDPIPASTEAYALWAIAVADWEPYTARIQVPSPTLGEVRLAMPAARRAS